MLVALPSSIAFGVLVFSVISPQMAGEGAFAGMIGAAALGLTGSVVWAHTGPDFCTLCSSSGNFVWSGN